LACRIEESGTARYAFPTCAGGIAVTTDAGPAFLEQAVDLGLPTTLQGVGWADPPVTLRRSGRCIHKALA
jgi:hypothetical protein